jgi:hypothetical protein
MATRDKPHLLVTKTLDPVSFTLRRAGGSTKSKRLAEDKRAAHVSRLLAQLQHSIPEDRDLTKGTHISFESSADLQMAIDSLDVRLAGEQPRLVSVTQK